MPLTLRATSIVYYPQSLFLVEEDLVTAIRQDDGQDIYVQDNT
ncbi:MAG TPA: hypothetical protein VLG09_04255 [Candidatus Saccharimonadales bacterium]|nr:hypothetical protein [Candidatus Saccharimonadales bacterium]